MNFSAKTVVVIAIGAALYGIGGLPMFGVPVFANTTLKPAMAVLALFSVLFGLTCFRVKACQRLIKQQDINVIN